MSDGQESGSHRYDVQVTFETDIDPDRVEEWCRANFDDETVILLDLDEDVAHRYDGGEFRDAL